jgi:CRISPR type III-A-associated protein Csm2
MEDQPIDQPISTTPEEAPPAAAPAPEAESAKPEAAQAEAPKAGPPRESRPPRPPREPRPEQRQGGKPEGQDRNRGERPRQDRPRHDRPFAGGRPEMMADIDLEKLISDSLYLDNAAHAVVMRMRDMDSGTRSQLRRFYNAVRRAYRAPEGERQHHFVMLRARLAYTIARHSLRSLDGLERLLLQVTRKNDTRGYERFRDLFEAIVAYNE